jgi:hypothetical protein
MLSFTIVLALLATNFANGNSIKKQNAGNSGVSFSPNNISTFYILQDHAPPR